MQAESGVVVRMLDALNKHDGAMWEPCPHGTWCAKYGAIWPSTLINREHNAVWYAGKAFAGRDGVQSSAGLVLAPPPLNRFFCIYPRDGNAMVSRRPDMPLERVCAVRRGPPTARYAGGGGARRQLDGARRLEPRLPEGVRARPGAGHESHAPCTAPRAFGAQRTTQAAALVCAVQVWDCSYPPEELEAALVANSHAAGKYNEVAIETPHTMLLHIPVHSVFSAPLAPAPASTPLVLS